MKIGLCGTISVGKTTLVKELSKLPQFKDYEVVTERSKYSRDLGIPLNLDSTHKGQLVFMAERASELLKDNLLTDRTILDVLTFTSLSKSMTEREKESIIQAGEHLIEDYDFIFYVSPEGVELEDNGVRAVDPKYREDLNSRLSVLIFKYKDRIKNFGILSGSTEERIKQLMGIVFP